MQQCRVPTGTYALVEVPQIRGAIVLNNLVGFAEVVGQDTVDRAIAGLPQSVADEVGALVSASWIRAASVDVLFGAIARAAGLQPSELFPEAIERGVSRTLNTVWRALLQITSDAAIIKRTPTLYRRTYSRGRLEVRSFGDAAAQVELVDWPDVSDTRLVAVASGMRAVLRIAGRKAVHVASTHTRDGAMFDVRWTR